MAKPLSARSSNASASSHLAMLGRTLDQLRRRSYRQWRHYQSIDEGEDAATASNAHKEWSDSIDEALGVADAISREPVHDLTDLVLKFDAVWWWIVEDDSVLDLTVKRR